MNTAALRAFAKGRRFRFDGVMVDEAAARLFVDGRERLCSQRALRLIVVMCESGGQVLPKQRVIDQLWPGGQIVSDEALTQLVFRARNCLDSYADRLVTVRGVGLRLDAAVAEIEDDGEEAPDASPLSAPMAVSAAALSFADTAADLSTAPAAASEVRAVPAVVPLRVAEPRVSGAAPKAPARAPSMARRALGMIALFALLAVGLVALLQWRGDGDIAVLEGGYGLLESDAHTDRPETLALLREAFAHDAQGDRARARALLETAHDSDSRTPLPALFLALWAAGGGDAQVSDRWLDQARTRVAPLASAPLTALLRYVEAERHLDSQDILRYAGALLDMRPAAWQFRLARAHLLLGDGLRDAALQELQRVEVNDLSHRKLVAVLADRASLGDPDGAEAVFARIAASAPAESTRAYLRGRFAWSRGDYAASAAAYTDTVAAARREARFDLAHRAQVNLGALALLQGEPERAVALLEQAREGMLQGRWVFDEIDLSLMLAQLHALAGDTAATIVELDRAAQVLQQTQPSGFFDLHAIYRARLHPAAPVPATHAGADPALAPLLAAHAAWRAGDAAAAVAQYEIARRRLSHGSPLHDELRLLALLLGQPPDVAQVVDPPYPPLARLATRLAAQRLEAAKTHP